MNPKKRLNLSESVRHAGMLMVFGFSTSLAAAAPERTGCKLAYPVVLSHHWGTKAICSDTDTEGPNAGVTSERCEQIQPAKYCRGWSADLSDPEDLDCTGGWGVPKAELNLPPRNYHLDDPTLVRDLGSNQRYYSSEIVEAIEACGNQVFISDKPAFAGYRERAISLKATVKRALEQTGAQKVVIFGHSQGSQDARYLINALPLGDTSSTDQSDGRLMGEQVAALVSTSGEPFGAEASGIGLKGLYATNVLFGSGWLDWKKDPMLKSFGRAAFDQSFWKIGRMQDAEPKFTLGANGEPVYVLSAADKTPLNFIDRYKAYLRSTAELSPSYMRAESAAWGWEKLVETLGMKQSFQVDVPIAIEADSPTNYFSYGAQVQGWNPDWGSSLTYDLIRLGSGANDGYVSVSSQNLARLPRQGEHIHTLTGSGSGYHHMFYTGENPMYGPKSADQDPAYPGGAADFYVHALRDLVARGYGASTESQ